MKNPFWTTAPRKGTETPSLPPPDTTRPTQSMVLYDASGRGQMSPYRRQGSQPARGGLVARVQRLWERWKKIPESTTEAGSSASSSPSSFQNTLLSLRYERRAIIADCRLMYAEDNRCKRSVTAYAAEATRGGCSITVSDKTPAKWREQATAIAEDVQKLFPQSFVRGCAEMAYVEGDLFTQFILDGNRLVGVKRMPASSMERVTGDCDEFADTARAFEQVDTNTNSVVDSFSRWQIHHGRWDWIPGERYGQSGLLSLRRNRRKLELLEEGQVVGRLMRARQSRIFNIGTEANPDTDGQAVERFKRDNGFIGGNRDPFDVMEAGRDFFGNGLLSGTVLQGDSTVNEIDDIKYLADTYTSGLPTPAFIYGYMSDSINRDVTEEQRAEWLKYSQIMSDFMKQPIEHAYELALLLAGILPEAVTYTVQYSVSSIEKRSEQLGDIVTAVNAGLLPEEVAVQKVADLFDVNPIMAAEMLEKQKQVKKQEAAEQMALTAPPAPAQGKQEANGNSVSRPPVISRAS